MSNPMVVETDFALQIKVFANDVFHLKDLWREQVDTVTKINQAVGPKARQALEQYLAFVQASQSQANAASGVVFNTFTGDVVSTAKDPEAERLDKLGSAEEFLTNLPSIAAPTWIENDTVALYKKIDDVVGALNHLKEKDEQTQTDLAVAMDQLNDLDKQRDDLHKQIGELIAEESKGNVVFRGAKKILFFILLFSSSDFQVALDKILGTLAPSSRITKVLNLLDQVDGLTDKLDRKKEEIARLKKNGTKAASRAEALDNAIDDTLAVRGTFRLISPKLDQLCVFSEAIGVAVSEWRDFLRSEEAKQPDPSQGSIESLENTKTLYEPIAVALQSFVARMH